MTQPINSSQSSIPIMTAPVATRTTTSLEPIQEIIPRTKLGKSIVGKTIKCRFCSSQALIVLEEKRYMVRCGWCGDCTHLKTYNL